MSTLKALVVGFLALPSVFAIPAPSQNAARASFRTSARAAEGSCPAPIAETTTARVPSPFKAFTQDEVDALAAWLRAPERNLNLTDHLAANLAMSDNYLWHIEELKPNKTDVLAYLDQGVPMPRYARVVIHEGGKEVPVVADYFVGTSHSRFACKCCHR